MALRVKTVEYAFPSYTGVVAPITRYNFSAITLHIPELVSRTFRSVRLCLFCRDVTLIGAGGTSPLLGIKLGAVAFNDLTMGTVSQSGENWSAWWERDVTSYFQTNFGSGVSQTCQAGFIISGPSITNIAAKLIITYEYEEADANNMKLKTVRIPLDSHPGPLTEVLSSHWQNQIPALNTFLPEGGKVYRDVWFEIWYNENLVGVTVDPQLGMALDFDAEHLTGLHESGLASSCTGWYVWKPTFDKDQTHELKLRTTAIANGAKFNHPAVLLCVTYEYDRSFITQVFNSLLLGMEPQVNAGAGSYQTASPFEFWVEEPGPISLKQSGIMFTPLITTVTQIATVPGKAYQKLVVDENVIQCGISPYIQRIDRRVQGENLCDRGDCES